MSIINRIRSHRRPRPHQFQGTDVERARARAHAFSRVTGMHVTYWRNDPEDPPDRPWGAKVYVEDAGRAAHSYPPALAEGADEAVAGAIRNALPGVPSDADWFGHYEGDDRATRQPAAPLHLWGAFPSPVDAFFVVVWTPFMALAAIVLIAYLWSR